MSSGRGIAVRRWGVAVLVYLLAVFHRTALGVAGLQAASRFHISASELSIFVLLQLGVYAAMQIPTGILVDRYGPRRLLIAAATLMGLAQLLFAFAANYPLALLARALLGCGDALTFVSVLRFAGSQFSPRRYPMMVSITAMIGTAGNVVATVPLTFLLRSLGWTPTFAVAAGMTLLSGAAVYRILPPAVPLGRRLGMGASSPQFSAEVIANRIRTAWSMPGTRVGFWLHFTTMSTSLMIGVLWGVPFMVQGQAMSRGEASAVLLAGVLFGVLMNPIVGYLISRNPFIRVPLAIGVTVVTASWWLVVLALFTGPIPRELLIALFVFSSLGGPASGIGFAMARDYNSPRILGTATGVVNVGGFMAATLASLIVGATLDLVGSNGAHAFRLAFAAAISVQVIGLVQMIRWWLKARRSILAASAKGETVPVPIVRRPWDLAERQL